MSEIKREEVVSLISESSIQQRINELAEVINQKYEGKTITLICVLKGGVFFMVDLAKKLKPTVEFDFLDISSYNGGTESSGHIKINKDLENPITGKNVILIEDIIDTGLTLSHLKKHLANQNPDSFEICTLLDKPERREVFDVVPEYVGFVIPNEFVIGYGLDYEQRYRNLPLIGVLKFVN